MTTGTPEESRTAASAPSLGSSEPVRMIEARLARPRLAPGLYAGNVRAVLERGWQAYRSQNWLILVSGFFEPVLYLLAMGLGVGALVGTVPGPDGQPMRYLAFIAPALLATSAMNGAVYDSTMNVFFKLKFGKQYQVMLQTAMGPIDVAVGEIVLALLRGLLYAVGFMAVMIGMGVVTSWWAVLMIPSALLIALGFAALGMAITSYFTTFQQLDVITFAMLPMFLFSASLYPIGVFPEAIQWFIKAMPLWHGVEMMRQFSVGFLTWGTVGHALYFVGMTVIGVVWTTVRLRKLFLR